MKNIKYYILISTLFISQSKAIQPATYECYGSGGVVVNIELKSNTRYRLTMAGMVLLRGNWKDYGDEAVDSSDGGTIIVKTKNSKYGYITQGMNCKKK